MQKISHAIINRIHVRLGLVAALVGCFSLNASAAVQVTTNGNTKTIMFPSNTMGGSATYFDVAIPGGSNSVPTKPPPGISPYDKIGSSFGAVKTPNSLSVVGYGDIPLGDTGKKISNAKINAVVPKRAFGKALTLAGKLAWPIGVIISVGEIAEYLNSEGIFDLKNTPNGITGKIVKKSIFPVSDGYKYYVYGNPTYYESAELLCSSVYGTAPQNFANGVWQGCSYSPPRPTQYKSIHAYKSDCPAGSVVKPDNTCEIESGIVEDVDQQAIEDAIAISSGWPSSAARALASALNTPGVGVETEPVTVTGPSTVTGSKTTTTESVNLQPGTNTPASPGTASQTGTKTTTKTETHNVTYNNNSTSYTTSVVTTTNITNNVTNTTTTEGDKTETKEDDAKPEEEKPDYCEKNPDALMCQKIDLDSPDTEIPKLNRNVDLVEENLFGGGSCPADVYFAPRGLQSLKVWDWNQSCGYITSYVKPVLIICCTFAAFMILVPGRTE